MAANPVLVDGSVAAQAVGALGNVSSRDRPKALGGDSLGEMWVIREELRPLTPVHRAIHTN